MVKVQFYDHADDRKLRFAVIITKTNGHWVFCKHRERDTLEIPGGHREPGESIPETAKRELYEETGAIDFTIRPVCVYSVTAPGSFDGQETFGMLFYAEVKEFEHDLHSEIERIVIQDELPSAWTYPDIQPFLLLEAEKRITAEISLRRMPAGSEEDRQNGRTTPVRGAFSGIQSMLSENKGTDYQWIEDKVPEGMKVTQVYGIILDREGRVMLRVENTPDGVIYSLPGGRPESFDSGMEETCRREVLEEVNTEIEKPVYIGYQLADEKNGSLPYAQIRMAALIKSIGETRPDPDNGKTYRRYMVMPERAAELLRWGDVGYGQIMKAKETVYTQYGISGGNRPELFV